MTDKTKAPERIFAWTYDEWKSAWNVDDEESPPHAAPYIREDVAQALIAAAYEDAAQLLDGIEGADVILLNGTSPDARAALDWLIAEAMQAEREACAKVAEDRITGNGIKSGRDIECDQIAAAIRARKSPPADEG